MKKTILIISMIIATLFLISACTTTQNTQNPTITPTPNNQIKELKVEAYNFGFNVNNVQINKGDRVKITLTSKDGTHGLSLPAFNVAVGPVSPGETKTAEFTADKSGTFDYRCNVPCGSGHMDMKGKLIVN